MRRRKSLIFKRVGDPIADQKYAREALEMANALPDTTTEGAFSRGVREGFIIRVDKNTYKLVGGRGLERE